ARYLEGSELPLAMPDEALQQLGRGLASLPQHDAGPDLLAADLVGHRDDGGFPDLRQRVQHRFQLARGDVLAAPAHHVLEAPDNMEEAPLVLAEEIAGSEPVAVEGGGRGLGLAPIALHDARSADEKLAGFARRQGAARVIGHAAFAERARQAA